MTVNPGWGGQTLLPECLDKVRKLRRIIDSRQLDTMIEVDGGVNAQTAPLCREAGADILVAGSFFFNHSDKLEASRLLKQ
jgi:ribulose-phosphate 3-epimerase